MPTQAEQDEILARSLAKKIRLENRFKPDLRRFFKQVSKDATTKWLSTRNIPNLNSFSVELIAMLRAHYRRVNRAFGKQLRKEAKKSFLFIETKQEENIDTEIVEYINQHSVQQSEFILQTTERELNNIAATVSAAAILEGLDLTNQQIARNIEKEFNNRAEGRIETIAMTETQTPSQEISYIEALGVSAVAQQQGQAVLKTWNTVLDEKTRPAHVAADRQEKRVNDPYIVKGERLPVPGSTALGASLANIINCRCESINSLTGEVSPIFNSVTGEFQ